MRSSALTVRSTTFTTSGLVLMGARPYDPSTGRFLSVDPVDGGSLNNYDYAGQDPVDNYDLSGTCIVHVSWVQLADLSIAVNNTD